MHEEIYAVVVLYNTSVANSSTCANLLKIKNHSVKVIVIDNSTIRNDNLELCIEYGFEYFSMKGNAGLSKAYNRALNYLRNKKGIVVWFDDDTNVTQKYFDELQEVSEFKEYDIFTPIIRGQDGRYWSPNSANYLKNCQLKNSNQKISQKKYNAINSCTACRLEIYTNYRYDERLFLDQIDQKFFDDQRQLGRRFYQMNTIINHNFSLKSNKQKVNKLKLRYSQRIKDLATYTSIQQYPLYLCKFKVAMWGVKETLSTKNMAIFKFFLKKVFEIK